MAVDWPQRAQEFCEELEARTFFRFTYDDPVVGVMHFQRIAGLRVDGEAGGKTFGTMRGLFPRLGESQDPFKGWCHPMPIWEGVSPIISSSYVDDQGNGPNQWRYRDNVKQGRKLPGHLGVDLVYPYDGKGPKPATLFEHRFYCPPVPVYAMGPGQVVYAKWLDVSERWGGDRLAVKIDHGYLPGWGRCMTWSVHHSEIHVKSGDTVEAGTLIATAGDTGCKGAPHVHQEIWQWERGKTPRRRRDARDPGPVLERLPMKEAA